MIYPPAWACLILCLSWSAACTVLSLGCIHYRLLYSCKSIERYALCSGLHPKEEEETIFIWGKLAQFMKKCVKSKHFLLFFFFFGPWIFMENNSAEDTVGVFYTFSGNTSLLEISLDMFYLLRKRSLTPREIHWCILCAPINSWAKNFEKWHVRPN